MAKEMHYLQVCMRKSNSLKLSMATLQRDQSFEMDGCVSFCYLTGFKERWKKRVPIWAPVPVERTSFNDLWFQNTGIRFWTGFLAVVTLITEIQTQLWEPWLVRLNITEQNQNVRDTKKLLQPKTSNFNRKERNFATNTSNLAILHMDCKFHV